MQLPRPEPTFWLDDHKALKVPGAAEELLRHLQLSIGQRPTDLKSHTRRILLAVQSGSADQCYGALLDLFIALGGRGEGLKRNLLDQAVDRLSEAQQAFLARHLSGGLEACAHFPLGHADAVLTRGLLGRPRAEELQA